MTSNPLAPIRHQDRDFFIADIFDNLPVKDDKASMEYPLFSLSIKPDLRDIEYKYNGASVKIQPNSNGLPTIFDKDVLLYCASLLMNEYNKTGVCPPKTVRISCHDFMVATNRAKDGNSYRLLKKSLERLAGALITTSIKTNGREQAAGFHMIDSYRIVESSRVKDRMVRLEIKLSDWFYNSILGKEVLTINKDYFRLKKPTDRRIYELARKHCGKDKSWKIGLDKLHFKTGSTAPERKFRYFINEIIKTQHIPDYKLSMQDDVVTFYSTAPLEAIDTDYVPDKSLIHDLRPDTLMKAKKMVETARLDFYALVEDFVHYNSEKGTDIENLDGLFIGFIKKKTKESPAL